jgi:hypothetical protein
MNTILLAAIAGMLAGKWIFEPLIDIWLNKKRQD